MVDLGLRRLDVDIDGIFLVGGRFEPRAVRLYKSHAWLPIVRVDSVERAANRKVGGAGLRYRCQVLEGFLEDAPVQRTRTLWREGDTWFVEEQVEEADL